MRKGFLRKREGFTLAEVMIVTLIVTILAVVTVSAINPIELLRQSRDVKRISDLTTLNKAVSIYYSDALNNPSTLFMGTSSVVYVSVPDPNATGTAGNQCNALNLPALPSGYSYHCSASSTYARMDGTGWVPINFNNYSAGTIISSLPVDPTNNTSTNLYYTYETDGVGGYKLSSFLESQKDEPLMATDNGDDAELYEKGTNLALASGRGLVGYWPMDECSGSSTVDMSGFGETGGWFGNTTNGKYYMTGKVGQCAGAFGGTNTEILVPTSTTNAYNIAGPVTMSAWVYPLISNAYQNIIYKGNAANVRNYAVYLSANGTSQIYIAFGNTSGPGDQTVSVHWATNTWNYIVVTADGTTEKIYVNGQLAATVANSLDATTSTNPLVIGLDRDFNGFGVDGGIDDVRIYDYALPAAQIQEMYNAEK